MLPGEYLVVLDQSPMPYRAAGLELRDTLIILTPGPSVHIAHLFRHPICQTVAETALRHGTGGLNVDGCRVGPNPGYSYSADRNGTTFHGQQGARVLQTADKRGSDRIESKSGRWPTNLLLVHGPGCQRVGEKRVKGITGNNNAPVRRSGVHVAAGGHQTLGRVQNVPKKYHDAEGKETVPSYDCQPDCPVRLLDRQSGNGTGAHGRSNLCYDHAANGWGHMHKRASEIAANPGTASRFYPQFPDLHSAIQWLQSLTEEPQQP